jgi:hypothetical protein
MKRQPPFCAWWRSRQHPRPVNNEGRRLVFGANDAATVDAIKELIDTRVRPRGGWRWLRHHLQGLPRRRRLPQDEGRLLRLPPSTATPRHGIENLLKHFLPEVQAIEQFEA